MASGPSRRGRYTQKQIADDLGISLITVQRALNGTGYVSSELRQRIDRHVRKIGYKPHRAAQSLARSEPRQIAVLSSDFPNYFWSDIARGVEIAARQVEEFGYRSRYLRVPVGDTEGYLRRLRRLRREGVEMVAVVNHLEYDMKRVFETLDRWKLPYITFNTDAPETNRLATVTPDYTAEGRLAADFLRHFAEPGDLHCLVKSDPPSDDPAVGADISAMRDEGFRAVLGGYSLRSETIQLDRSISPADQARQVRRVLEQHRGACGVFLTHLVPAFLERLLPIAGIKVITSDYTPDLRQYLMRDELDAVIFSNPILQGYYAVKMMEQYLELGQVRDNQLTVAHSLMLKENIALQANQLYEFDSIAVPEGTLS